VVDATTLARLDGGTEFLRAVLVLSESKVRAYDFYPQRLIPSMRNADS